MRRASNRAYLFLPTEVAKTLQRMVWYCDTLDSMWGLFPTCRVVSWRRGLATAHAMALKYLSSTRRNRSSCSTFFWSYLAEHMYSLFKRMSSRNSMIPLILQMKVIWGCFACFIPLLQLWEPSVGKNYWSLKPYHQRQYWRSGKAQYWWRHWPGHVKNVPFSRLFEKVRFRVLVAKRRAMLKVWFGLVAVLLNLDATYDDQLRMPRSVNWIYSLEVNVRHRVDTMTSNQSSLADAHDSSLSQPLKKKRLFLRSRFSTILFLSCSGEAPIYKDASDETCHHSSHLFISKTWQSATYGGWMGSNFPYGLSCMIYFVSCIA